VLPFPSRIDRTPLHLAVNCRRGGTDDTHEVEERLLSAGAQTDVKDDRGRIALHYAFVKRGAHTDHSHMDPIDLVELLEPIEDMPAEVPDTTPAVLIDNFGSTPLHYAAQRGATISCMHLLRSMDMNPTDDNGNTPLGLAVLYGHEGMC
jgi:ankyrin repeat protein